MNKSEQIAALREQLNNQIFAAFATAVQLEGLGVFQMHLVKNGMLSTADALPDKTLAHALRQAIFKKGSTPAVEASASTGFRRNTKAPVYGAGVVQPVAQPPKPEEVKLEEGETAQTVQNKFTAPVYGATPEQVEASKQNPPAAKPEAEAEGTKEVIAENTGGEGETEKGQAEEPQTEQPKAEEVKPEEPETEQPKAEEAKPEEPAALVFFPGTPKEATPEKVLASSPEEIAANFSLADLKEMLEKAGYEGAAPRSKIAAANHLLVTLKPTAAQ